jgi:hypothetical protein
VDELVRGLKLALEDPEELRDLLQPSFDLVAREVTLDAMARKVLQVYERIAL